jgi:hypothetical protein
MKRKVWLSSLLSGAAAVALQAHADMITYDINVPNTALSGLTGPYATATVDLTSSTMATITFTSLTAAGNIYLLGDGGSVDVNVNAASWTLSNILGSNAGIGFTPGPWSSGGSGNVSSFGVFNQTINSFDGLGHSSDTISFDLQNTSGTWASAADVLTGNAAGNSVAAHIFVTSNPANAANGALVTGFATDDGGSNVPDAASTLGLLGLALTGVAGLRRHLAKI